MSDSVRVVARIRPLSGSSNVLDVHDDTTVVLRGARNEAKSFTFDRVFNVDASQQDVFDYAVRSTADDIIKGYNGCVLMYGE